MWPFSRKQDVSVALRRQATELAELLSEAFNTPGSMYGEQRAQVVGAWLSKIQQALEQAARAAYSAKDKPDALRQTLASVKRLCEDCGKPEHLKRLEGVCGPSIRDRFEQVLKALRAVSR